MKAHIGVDARTGLVHSLAATSAYVQDTMQAHRLLHGGETAACLVQSQSKPRVGNG